MKTILFILLSVLVLTSCGSNVNKQELAINKTKELLKERKKCGYSIVNFIGVDTVITQGIINSKDSVVNVIFKGDTELGEYYFQSQVIISMDTIKQINIISSGSKEHCISYVHGY